MNLLVFVMSYHACCPSGGGLSRKILISSPNIVFSDSTADGVCVTKIVVLMARVSSQGFQRDH